MCGVMKMLGSSFLVTYGEAVSNPEAQRAKNPKECAAKNVRQRHTMPELKTIPRPRKGWKV